MQENGYVSEFSDRNAEPYRRRKGGRQGFRVVRAGLQSSALRREQERVKLEARRARVTLPK